MIEVNGDALGDALVRVAEAEMVEAVKDVVHTAAFAIAEPSELGDFLSSGAQVRLYLAQTRLERAKDYSRVWRGKTVLLEPTLPVED